jgi:hypothetical protein
MQKTKGLLLASFITTDDEQEILTEVEFIAQNLELTTNYIFLMRNVKEPSKKILTYNAVTEKGKAFNPRLYTMRVHRKKHSHTLYTINALNLAVAAQHDGKTGKDLRLDWEPYRSSILLSAANKLQVHPVEVVKIFKIEPLPEEN